MNGENLMEERGKGKPKIEHVEFRNNNKTRGKDGWVRLLILILWTQNFKEIVHRDIASAAIICHDGFVNSRLGLGSTKV